jgi:hypothetical protein
MYDIDEITLKFVKTLTSTVLPIFRFEAPTRKAGAREWIKSFKMEVSKWHFKLNPARRRAAFW